MYGNLIDKEREEEKKRLIKIKIIRSTKNTVICKDYRLF